MSHSARIVVAAPLVLVGATVALISVGQVGSCLGPIGVTEVQCAKATGVGGAWPSWR
jgi:hypothetical protein